MSAHQAKAGPDFESAQKPKETALAVRLKNLGSIEKYFRKNLQYKKIKAKISGNKKTVFLKFPILKEIGLVRSVADSPNLFVRCDFSNKGTGNYSTDINTISTNEFTIFIFAYDLPTLFANKISAFLERKFFKGKEQKISFKGRDIYDLIWFLGYSKRNNWQLQPNWERIFKTLKVNKKDVVISLLIDKIAKINKIDVIRDLTPFIETNSEIENFSDNFNKIMSSDLIKLIK